MATTVYVCSNCGKEFRKWSGKCSECGAFGTVEEQLKEEPAQASVGLKSSAAQRPLKRAETLSQIGINPIRRTASGIGELDRVLGGGLVDAEVILFAGAPGAGKSTLCMNLASNYGASGKTVLYSSGEESAQQIALRASRMAVTSENIHITNETSLEVLLGHIDELKPELVIVDSLQTLASEAVAGSVGSISQSKEAANTLVRIAKTRGIAMVLINQLIKSGDFAGSESLLHIVDCGLMLESDDESPLKILRALKNRFGDIGEIGCFVHTAEGLQEVSDPGEIFLDSDAEPAIQGAACGFISEGLRQIPVEVQALAVTSSLANPRKQFNGVNFTRGQIVCAILDKYLKTSTYTNDVFASTVAGVKINDPLADLAVAAALLSTLDGKKISRKTIFVGELSLTGAVRGNSLIENKIREAERLGFERIVIPKSAKVAQKFSIAIERISRAEELKNFLQ